MGLLLADYSPWLLLEVASAGNVLGAAINWLLGRAIDRYGSRRWFPEGSRTVERRGPGTIATGDGRSLIWVPVIGDPLTFVAGVLRERLVVFLIFVTIAKVGRYARRDRRDAVVPQELAVVPSGRASRIQSPPGQGLRRRFGSTLGARRMGE